MIKLTYHEPKRVYRKDPDEIQSFQIDWSKWLKTDTISSSTVDSDGLTIDSNSDTNTTTTFTISGGNGKYCVITRVVTAAGLKEEKVVIIRVIDNKNTRLCN